VAVTAATGRPVVFVTDRLAGDAILAAIRTLRPDAVVIDTGPARSGVVGPAVMAHGSGAATAAAVAELLFA
jgi:hypothetical protein